MIHLTLLGRPFCGTDADAMPALQTPIEELREDICRDCLAVWSEIVVEYHLEPIRNGYHAWAVADGLTIATETFTDADHKHVGQSAREWLRFQGAEK